MTLAAVLRDGCRGNGTSVARPPKAAGRACTVVIVILVSALLSEVDASGSLEMLNRQMKNGASTNPIGNKPSSCASKRKAHEATAEGSNPSPSRWEPRVRIHFPPAKSSRANLKTTSLGCPSDGGPRVRIHLPPAGSQVRTRRAGGRLRLQSRHKRQPPKPRSHRRPAFSRDQRIRPRRGARRVCPP